MGKKVKPEVIDESRLRQIVTHLPYFAVIVESERRYLWVNRLDPTLELSDVIGRRVDDFVNPEWHGLVQRTIARAFDHREIGYYEVCAYGAGGMSTWYGTKVVPLPVNAHGEPTALLLATDVTRRHRAEAALRESEARFRMLTEASPDFIYIVDRDGTIQYANREPPVEASLSSSHVVGRTLESFVEPESQELASRMLGEVFASGEPRTYEITSRLTGRSYVSRAALLPEHGGAERAVIFNTDITDQKRAARERERLQVQLEQAQKMESVGQLAGGVAHDFNNLLMVIQMHLRFARTAFAEGKDAAEELEQAQWAAQRAGELTRRLLAFSRRQPIVPTVVRASEFVESAVGMLRRLIPESICLRSEISGDGWVSVDVGQLEQVLINLCVNARDAIGDAPGSIEIVVDRHVPVSSAEDPAGVQLRPYVTIAVHDSGSGVPEAVAPSVFEPFFTTKEPEQGTGLGLAVVHGIVKQHRGEIRLEDPERGGATFRIYLPEATPEGREDPAGEPAASPVLATGGGETILVAEDDDAVRRIVVRILEFAGYRVLQAEDGQAAVALLNRGEAIDLVLLDVVMPELGGKAAFEEIRRIAPGLPIIFCSGYTGDALPASLLAREQLRLLSKPFRPETLLEAVREALGKSGAS